MSNMQIPAEIRGQKIAMSSKKNCFFYLIKRKRQRTRVKVKRLRSKVQGLESKLLAFLRKFFGKMRYGAWQTQHALSTRRNGLPVDPEPES